jgi:hypothetical protein
MRGLLAFGLGMFACALCSCATTEPVGVTHTTSAVVMRREVRRTSPFPISRSDTAYFRLAGRADLGLRNVDAIERSSASLPMGETNRALPRSPAVHAAAPRATRSEPPPPPAHHGPPNA